MVTARFFLCIASGPVCFGVFCGRYISTNLSSMCPVLPNSSSHVWGWGWGWLWLKYAVRPFWGSFLGLQPSLICPLCVLCFPILRLTSQKQFCFRSSLHSHFSQFTEFLSPSPSLCCILPAASRAPVFISLGYYCELQGGNSTVVGMLSYWREDCHYRRSITITVTIGEVKRDSGAHVVQLPHLLIVPSLPPAGVKTIAVGRYQEVTWSQL